MTLRSLALAAALVLGTPAPALAADAAAASELARLMLPKATWSENLDLIAKQVQMQLSSHPGAKLEYPADFPKTVRAELDKSFPYDEMIGGHTKELAAAYTDAELKEVLAFFKSPTGARWLKTSGEAQGKADMETQKRFQERMPDIMTRLAKLSKTPAAPAKAAGMPGMPAGHPPMAPAEKKAEPAPVKK